MNAFTFSESKKYLSKVIYIFPDSENKSARNDFTTGLYFMMPAKFIFSMQKCMHSKVESSINIFPN